MEQKKYSSLCLAFIGDAVYELKIRDYLIKQGIAKVNDLKKESLKYVSANRQAYFVDLLLKDNYFSDEDMEMIKNARNSKTHSKPKNCDILTYKHATALEAIFGYYYLNNEIEKVDDLILKIVNL